MIIFWRKPWGLTRMAARMVVPRVRLLVAMHMTGIKMVLVVKRTNEKEQHKLRKKNKFLCCL